jgi:predicted RNA-binding Zn-ribbon protein involved in translation (DUF1610 family)
MISFTCPCGKTLNAYDEHAAEMMPCPECGRVHVIPRGDGVQTTAPPLRDQPTESVRPQAEVPRSPTFSFTTSAPALTERGSTTPPDTATTDQRPIALNASLLDIRPVTRNCPKCGSASFTRVRVAPERIAFTNDRKCKECGTRYTPPTPAWAAVVFIVLGGLISGGGLLAIAAFVWTLNARGDLEHAYMAWPLLVLVLGGIPLLIYGIRTLTKGPSIKELDQTIPGPLSQTVQTAMYLSGVLCLLGCVVSGLVWLAGVQGRMKSGSLSAPLYGVIFQAMIGLSMLRMPDRIQQLREKRLAEYRASASPGAPPPVETPRPPDAVFLGTIFGILSLFSAGAVAVLFGPAAIVCGLVALAHGRLKGLIGFGLGVVSLIVWGLVFVYFFQG